MRPIHSPLPLFAAVLLWTLSALAAPPSTGTWSAEPRGEALSLELHAQGSHLSQLLPRTELQGLETTDGVNTRFQLVREAGTLRFEGRFLHAQGAGTYQFEPSASWREAMAKRGLSGFSPEEQLLLALQDMGPTRLDALAALGYRELSKQLLIQVALFRVTPEYIREIRAEGHPQITLEQLVRLRIHAIDARYIRSLSTLGGPGRR